MGSGSRGPVVGVQSTIRLRRSSLVDLAAVLYPPERRKRPQGTNGVSTHRRFGQHPPALRPTRRGSSVRGVWLSAAAALRGGRRGTGSTPARRRAYWASVSRRRRSESNAALTRAFARRLAEGPAGDEGWRAGRAGAVHRAGCRCTAACAGLGRRRCQWGFPSEAAEGSGGARRQKVSGAAHR